MKMLVKSEPNSGPPSLTQSSILDSPTLARVERARIRLEASNSHGGSGIINGSIGGGMGSGGGGVGGVGGGIGGPQKREDSLERSILDPKHSLLAGRIPIAQMTGPIKRGILWQQRDRLFSRWKERYFILTRDYLHCFKRASGSTSEKKISDMGQFIFKVKLVDVEKVEWINRRSYSAISLLLSKREGCVLLRCEHGLEDWFELLEECTMTSKERRRILRLTQGPRSRASLAAPPCHASLQANHLGLGGTYSSAIEDWILSRHKSVSTSSQQFLHSDSVPDLSIITENHGIMTNHSTPKKVPNIRHSHHHHNNYSSHHNGYSSHNGSFCNNYPYSPLRKLMSAQNGHVNGGGGLGGTGNSNLLSHNSSSNSYIINDDDGEEVELRRGGRYHPDHLDEYRRPLGPHDHRHSLMTDIDISVSACDSGLDTPPTPPSINNSRRPSSYRDVYFMNSGVRDSTDTGVSSSRGTLISPGNSFRLNNNHFNNHINGSRFSIQEKLLLMHQQKTALNDEKNSIRSNNLKNIFNENYEPNQKNLQQQHPHQYLQQKHQHHMAMLQHQLSTAASNNNNQHSHHGSNNNINAKFFMNNNQANIQNNNINNNNNNNNNNINNNINNNNNMNNINNSNLSMNSINSLNNLIMNKNNHNLNNSINNMNLNNNHRNENNNNANNINNNLHMNGNSNPSTISNTNGSTGALICRERYQHPALKAIINEAQGMKFRDRSYSDCQQLPRRNWNNNTPSPKRTPFIITPTRV